MDEKDKIKELESALETIKQQSYFQGKKSTEADIERELRYLKKQEEIKSDYKAAYEKEYKKCGTWMLIGIVSIMVIVFFGARVITGVDDYDIDDQIGQYVCAQHKLSFDSVDISTDPTTHKISYMKIRCIDKTKEKSLADGYVVEIGRDEQALIPFNRRN